MNWHLKTALCIPFLFAVCTFASGNDYKNFDVATSAAVHDVIQMNDPANLESRWEALSKYVKYDKIYLEASREMIIADQASLDAEQLWITLFAKLPEITLWPIYTQYRPSIRADGTMVPDSRLGRIAGPVFKQVDQLIGKLGNPIGVKSYKPFHSSGEDYLQCYMGMIGIPMDIVPKFPTDAKTVLLTEQARFDPAIVAEIKKHLIDGKTVVITSGLLQALQSKGIEDTSDLVYTGRTLSTHEFMTGTVVGVKSDSEILLPQITYFTNDASSVISAYASASATSGDPMLLKAKYSEGLLYVVTIPNASGVLYSYPQPVLSAIRGTLAKEMFPRLCAPSQVIL